MGTKESRCRREAGKVPGEYYGEQECITGNENEGFCTVRCAKTTLFILNNVRGDDIAGAKLGGGGDLSPALKIYFVPYL